MAISLSNSFFLIISIFLVSETLSQVLSLEVIGKVFSKFYSIVIHLLILFTLVSYDDKSVLYYFVTLIALINSLRYVIYKIPAFEDAGTGRMFIDLVIIGSLTALIYVATNVVDFQFPPRPIVDEVKYFYLAAIVLVLLFELFQKASETGLNPNRFLPESFLSFLVILVSVVVGIGLVIATFLLPEYEVLAFQVLPFYVGYNIFFVIFYSLFASHDLNEVSISFVIPTFVTLTMFIGIIA
jgi:hypothetical protein